MALQVTKRSCEQCRLSVEAVVSTLPGGGNVICPSCKEVIQKFHVGDRVRINNRRLIHFGEEFTVTEVWGPCVYHGDLWNDERELELAE